MERDPLEKSMMVASMLTSLSQELRYLPQGGDAIEGIRMQFIDNIKSLQELLHDLLVSMELDDEFSGW